MISVMDKKNLYRFGVTLKTTFANFNLIKLQLDQLKNGYKSVQKITI